MSLMYAQMGMKIIGAMTENDTNKTQYKLQVLTQKYQKTMTALSAAQASNNLTANEIAVRDATSRAVGTLQLQSRANYASAEVGAAAAGVSGGSVAASLRGLTRSKLQAEEGIRKGTVNQGRINTAARRGLAMDVAYNRDVSVIAKPSAALALMGLGAGIIDIYDQHQPTGGKSTDAMAGWFRK